jgi:hypothetical protein
MQVHMDFKASTQNPPAISMWVLFFSGVDQAQKIVLKIPGKGDRNGPL